MPLTCCMDPLGTPLAQAQEEFLPQSVRGDTAGTFFLADASPAPPWHDRCRPCCRPGLRAPSGIRPPTGRVQKHTARIGLKTSGFDELIQAWTRHPDGTGGRVPGDRGVGDTGRSLAGASHSSRNSLASSPAQVAGQHGYCADCHSVKLDFAEALRNLVI